jgi:aryl-alcohol dehydrogenase-like predicted oxidoreductase
MSERASALPGTDQHARCHEEELAPILEAVKDLSSWAVCPPYTSTGEVAIRFALENSGINVEILGFKNASQVYQNMNIMDLPPLLEDIRQKLIADYQDKTNLNNLRMA